MEKKVTKRLATVCTLFLIMGALYMPVLAENPSDDPVLLHRWSFNGPSEPNDWPSDPNNPAHPLHDSAGGVGASIFGTAKITANALDLSSNTPDKNEGNDPNSGWAAVPIAGTLSALTDGFTMEAWFYLDAYSTNARIIDCGELGQYDEIYLQELMPDGIAGGFYNGAFDGNVSDFTPVDPNTWHHVVYTRSKSLNQSVLYLDGSPAGSGTSPSAPADLSPLSLCYLGRCYVPNWAVGGLLKRQD